MCEVFGSLLHRRGNSVHLLHAPEHMYHPGEDAVLQLQEPPGGHGGEPDADGDREEGRPTDQTQDSCLKSGGRPAQIRVKGVFHFLSKNKLGQALSRGHPEVLP